MAKTALAWGGGHTLHALGGRRPRHRVGGGQDVGAHRRRRPAAARRVGRRDGAVAGDDRGVRARAAAHRVRVGGGDRGDGCAGRVDGWRSSAPASRRCPQVAAALDRRPIAEVRVFSPTADASRRLRRAAAPARVGHRRASTSTRRSPTADIVTTATRARQPVLHRVLAGCAGRRRRGDHPERAELDGAIAATAVAGASATAPAPRSQLSHELDGATEVVPLSAVVAGSVTVPAAGHRGVQGDGPRPGRPRRRRRGARAPGSADAASRSPIAAAPARRHTTREVRGIDVSSHRFTDVSGWSSTGEPDYWAPIIFRARDDRRRDRPARASIAAPANGRRTVAVHPPPLAGRAPLARARASASRSTCCCPANAPPPIRHNSTMVGFGTARQRRASSIGEHDARRRRGTTAGTTRRGARTRTSTTATSRSCG